MTEEWRQQERRRVGRRRRALKIGLLLVTIGSVAWAIFQIGPSGQVLDLDLPSVETDAPQSQKTPGSAPTDVPVQEFVLKSYEPTEGFTTTVKPMRVWQLWEGTTSTTQDVHVEETPWVVLWSYRETSVLDPRFRVSITPRASQGSGRHGGALRG